jgi:hypothetical protein
MRTKALVVGGLALTAALAGGWAIAQTIGPGSGAFRGAFMHGQGGGGMGPAMMEHVGMAHGMMMGHPMMQGTGAGPRHGRPGLEQADPAELDRLKRELGIAPSQEPMPQAR